VKKARSTVAVLWTLVVLVLCLIPGYWLNRVEKAPWIWVPNLDKLVHWGLFVVHTILWLRVGSTRGRYVWVVLGGVALGIGTELGQKLPIVGRDGNRYDALSDICGVLVGLLVARFVEPLLRFVESRIFREAVRLPATAEVGTNQGGSSSRLVT
jgi:hypothetical protein